MSLSDWSNIAAIVNCAIVWLSVIYLARQLRQNELNQQALIQQGRAARISSLSLQMAQCEVSDAYEKGLYGEPISLADLHRFRNLCRAMFMSAEEIFFQYQRKVLHDEGFESFRKSIEVMMRMPGLRAMWQETRDMYGTKFVAFMDDIMLRVPVRTDEHELARWAETVEAIKGGGRARPARAA